MSLILCIESATTVCSVALFRDGVLLSLRELDAGFTHAENLHLFIRDCLEESKVSVKALTAIAVSKGPGSYTGLRIGVSTAKGLAYALHIPLIGIDTLQVIGSAAKEKYAASAYYCAMIDARRMEVYTQVFDNDLRPVTTAQALIVDDAAPQILGKYHPCVFGGDGAGKCAGILQKMPGSVVDGTLLPSARCMGALALEKFKGNLFEDLAYSEPFYLKDFEAGKKKKSAG